MFAGCVLESVRSSPNGPVSCDSAVDGGACHCVGASAARPSCWSGWPGADWSWGPVTGVVLLNRVALRVSHSPLREDTARTGDRAGYQCLFTNVRTTEAVSSLPRRSA